MPTKTEVMSAIPTDMFFLLDPDQRKALDLGISAEHAWIYGEDQTKRLQVLAQLIIHNVFEGSTTLICANHETEEQLTQLLDSIGLDSAFFHLRKPISKGAIAGLQIARKKGSKEETVHQATLALSQYNTWKEKLSGKYSAINRQVFGDFKWKQLVDKVAIGPDHTYKSLLAASLPASAFDLALKEYWHLRGRIKTLQRLRVLRTPAFDLLNDLHSDVFNHVDEDDLRSKIVSTLLEVVVRGRKLLGRIGELVHSYRRDVSGERHFILHQLRSEADRIEELLENGISQFGNDFILESTFNEISGRLKRSLSRSSREMHLKRDEVLHAYDSLICDLSSSPFETEDGHAWVTSRSLEQMRDNLGVLRNYLSDKAREIDSYAITNKRRLNARNITGNLDLQNVIQKLEGEIDTFASWVNNEHILQNHIEVNALSLEKCSLVVKEAVLKCKRLSDAMVDFEAYYLWRRFWTQLPENAHILLESLDILDDEDQVQAFDSWYFENILDQIPDSHIVTGAPPSEERKNHLGDLRSVVLNHIKIELNRQRHMTMREFKHKMKGLLNALSSSKINSTSDELHVLPAQSLSKLFPIVFCTPGQLRDYGYYFDTLLISDDTGGDFQSFKAQSNRCILFTNTIPANVNSLSGELSIQRLRIATLSKTFTWNKLPSSEKLKYLNSLACQLLPYISELKIYNGRDIQIFSFMGDICDNYVLSELKMPYKIAGKDNSNDMRHITESLLDSKKPIVILTRDGIMAHDLIENLFWQQEVLQKIESCGIAIFNTWSTQLKKNGITEMNDIIKAIRPGDNTRSLPVDEAVSA
jgi:hypothetical protein